MPTEQAGSRSAPTRATTPGTSSLSCARSTSLCTWRRTSAPTLSYRRPDHSPPGLRRQPAHQEADRGGLRLGQDRGRITQGPSPRAAEDRLAVHLRKGRLQPRPPTKATPTRIMPDIRQHGLIVHSDTAAHSNAADTSTLQNCETKREAQPRASFSATC